MAKDMDFLYQITENLKKVEAPVAVKGGLLLQMILQENHSDIERGTIDIDASWLKESPDIMEMREVLKQAVQLSFPDYDVTIRRPYGEYQSAGFEIRNEAGKRITHLDIDVDKPTKTKQYTVGETTITGISVEEMLSDKISAISSPQIMRRTKDLLDVYAITKSVLYDRIDLLYRLSEKDLGDFSTLKSRKEDLRHGYEKLRGVTNKPDFETVYETVSEYCSDLVNNMRNGVELIDSVEKLSAPTDAQTL